MSAENSHQQLGDHSTTSEAKTALPKDAHVITEILQDMGVIEWEPRVITQLLEFLYKYVHHLAFPVEKIRLTLLSFLL